MKIPTPPDRGAIKRTHQHLQHLFGLRINFYNVFLESRDLGGRETIREVAPNLEPM